MLGWKTRSTAVSRSATVVLPSLQLFDCGLRQPPIAGQIVLRQDSFGIAQAVAGDAADLSDRAASQCQVDHGRPAAVMERPIDDASRLLGLAKARLIAVDRPRLTPAVFADDGALPGLLRLIEDRAHLGRDRHGEPALALRLAQPQGVVA